MASPIIVPIVHPNGTSAAELLELREKAYDTLDAAADALKRMAPNARDYYPVPGRMEDATAQHTRRLKAIHGIMHELAEECSAINAVAR